MKTIAYWKSQRAEYTKKATAIRDVAKAQSRDMTSEEAIECTTLLDNAEECNTEISKLASNKDTIEARINALYKDNDEPKGRKTAPNSVAQIQTRDLINDDPKKGFKSHRQFMFAVMQYEMSHGRNVDERLKYVAAKLHARGDERDIENNFLAAAGSDEQGAYSDPYGGFLVPEGFSPTFLKIDPESDPMQGRTTMIPMTAPSIKFNARVDKNHTVSVSGGFAVSRSAETVAKSASREKFEQVELSANTLFGAAYATEEILTDSPISFAALIAAGFQDEFNSVIIDERINGDGVGKYLGFMKSPCLVTVSKEGSQSADTINALNIYKMRSRIYQYKDAIWLANQDCIPQLATLNVQVSTAGGQLVYMPSVREDIPDLLLGRPIIYSEYMQTLGDKGDLALCNFTQYLEGVYQPMQSAESIHVRFLNHERCYKFWIRNAGAPWWKSALTPKVSALTISPFIVLEAR